MIYKELAANLDYLQSALPGVPLKLYVSQDIYIDMMGMCDKEVKDYDPSRHINNFAGIEVEMSNLVPDYVILPKSTEHYDIFAEATKGKDFCAG